MPVVEGMIGLAVFGVAVNGYAAFKLSAGETLNERVLNWHLIEDVLGWVAVLIVSIVVVSLTNLLTLSSAEEKTYQLLLRLKAKESLKRHATYVL